MEKGKSEREWPAGFWISERYVQKLSRMAEAESRRTGRPCTKTDILLQLIRQAPEPGEKAG